MDQQTEDKTLKMKTSFSYRLDLENTVYKNFYDEDGTPLWGMSQGSGHTDVRCFINDKETYWELVSDIRALLDSDKYKNKVKHDRTY